MQQDVELLVFRHFVVADSEDSSLQPYVECLKARTVDRRCLEVRERLAAPVPETEEGALLFTLVQCLAMSPFVYSELAFLAAFQSHGARGLQRYHKLTVLQTRHLLERLSHGQLRSLLEFIDSQTSVWSNVSLLQTGVSAQLFRALLSFRASLKCNGSAATRQMAKRTLVGLLPHVLVEGRSRIDGVVQRQGLDQYCQEYMECYQRSYNFEECDTLQNVLELAGEGYRGDSMLYICL